MQSSGMFAHAEEAAFLRAIGVVARTLLGCKVDKATAGHTQPNSAPFGVTTAPSQAAEEEMQRILNFTKNADQLDYTHIYTCMHEYSNSVGTGITFHDRNVPVPVNFSAFEVVYRHSPQANVHTAEIPPKPHAFQAK